MGGVLVSVRQSHPNQLLASLGRDDFARLEPHLRPRTLRVRDNIDEPNALIKQVVFPTSGMLSLVTGGDESRIEVGIIGREGMSGAPLLLGVEKSEQECFVQAAGEAAVIDAGEFKRAISDRRSLHTSLLPYVHSFLQQTVETALANGRFTIEERLARWLLMSQDRLGVTQIPLTHEFLSIMLGVRRPGVTVALQILEGKHAIKNERGVINILKRDKLEDLANGAYRAPSRPH
jgi:CRP-like cAMP-binding protein